MKHLSIMIKPASSMCNMHCRYCFYMDVSQRRSKPNLGLMSHNTSTTIIKNIGRVLKPGDSVSFAFQGGEPTLAGLDFFEQFVGEASTQLDGVKIFWALQTNGILLDEKWCEFLRKKCFLVGLSIDGDAELHNQNRLDIGGLGTHAKVLTAKQLLEHYQVSYNVLCVLTNTLARFPQRIWKFILSEKIKHIQFIPCLNELDSPQNDRWALRPQRFFDFYLRLFQLWQKRTLGGDYISVKLFDDLFNLYVRGEVTSCGLHGRCQPQIVIEADGSVYPCDFYALDPYCAGNVADIDFQKILNNLLSSPFFKQPKATNNLCSTCKYLVSCGGGCKRMQTSMYFDHDGSCVYHLLLDKILNDLCRTGLIISSR
jgi:radical SAM additional 4Fe4S-binding domain